MAPSRPGGRPRARRPPPNSKFLYQVERHLPSVRLIRLAWLDATARLAIRFEGKPRLRRSVLPGVALALVAILAFTAWQLAPTDHHQADRIGVTEGQPSAGGASESDGLPAVPPVGPSAAPGSGGASGAVAVAPAVPRVAPAKSNAAWPSGVAAGSLTEAQRWVNFRGSALDVVITYTARSSWQSITHPWLGIDSEHFSGFGGTWVISQPLFPESGAEKGNLADCAAGDYDSKWRSFGSWLVDEGRGNSFVRLGWEFNGLWFAWAATDAEQWKQCFRNASTAIKKTSPSVRIDWNMNAHGSTTPVGAYGLYPGDEFVDVIGIDSYDMYPPSLTAEAFQRQCNGTEGLCRAIAFARERNKLFSVPEWGLVGQLGTRAGTVGQAGGDNPLYIREMHQVFAANADILAYEAYFNDDTPGNVHSSLVHPNRHPQSAEVYQQLW